MVPLRWAIRGCGNIAHDFVSALQSDSIRANHQVVALCASSIDRCEQFNQMLKLNIAADHLFDDESKFFALKDYDVVYIATINSEHHASTLKALRCGHNVLCEKPMGVNCRQVDEMINAAHENNVFLLEGYWTRYFPVWQKIQENIQAGAIGNVKDIAIAFGYPWPEGSKDKFTPENGGGILTATGCYMIMVPVMIFGEAPTKVIANATRLINGVDDSTQVILEFSGERSAVLLGSGSVALSNKCQIYGDKGYIEIDKNFWCPNSGVQYSLGESRTFIKSDDFASPFPKDDYVQWKYPNSIGFIYEAEAVRAAIAACKKQEDRMSHEHSRIIIKVIDEIRRQIGVKFPQDG